MKNSELMDQNFWVKAAKYQKYLAEPIHQKPVTTIETMAYYAAVSAMYKQLRGICHRLVALHPDLEDTIKIIEGYTDEICNNAEIKTVGGNLGK